MILLDSTGRIESKKDRFVNESVLYFSQSAHEIYKYQRVINGNKSNDIHLRDCPPHEPENAHSHLIAMLLGSSEVIPILDGELDLGRWQSVMLVELDGPRQRTVSVRLFGA